jgi:hypothetical protein
MLQIIFLSAADIIVAGGLLSLSFLQQMLVGHFLVLMSQHSKPASQSALLDLATYHHSQTCLSSSQNPCKYARKT